MQIIQMPNGYLMAMAVAWLISKVSEGNVHAVAYAVFLVAGIIWSYEEAARGINWFRRILGFVVLFMLLFSIIKIV